MSDDPQFEVMINGDKTWQTSSEFAEYDATHAVAGALLAGATHVSVSKLETDR